MKKNFLIIVFSILFLNLLNSQVNGKVVSPSFSDVNKLVTYSFEASSNSIVLTNRSSFKLEIVNIFPNGVNAIENELNNNFQPNESIKIPSNKTSNNGVRCFRSIVYKADDMELKNISGESQNAYTQRYNINKNRGCELMKLQAQMGKEVCQAINGSNACFSDAAKVLEQNNWCDNLETQQSVTNKKNEDINNIQILNSQNESNNINNAIETTANTIWEIIQNGRINKADLVKNFVKSIEQNLYDNKVNTNYYNSDITCYICNGSGLERGETGILAGKTWTCHFCNGLGKKYTLPEKYMQSKSVDPNKPRLSALADYLRNHQRLISEDYSPPMYKFSLDGYNGTIELRIFNVCNPFDKFLVVKSDLKYKILRKNGKYDFDANEYNEVLDYKLIPINNLVGVKLIKEETSYTNGTSFQTFNHFALIIDNGESFEFTSSDNSEQLISSINKLIQDAKKEYNGN